MAAPVSQSAEQLIRPHDGTRPLWDVYREGARLIALHALGDRALAEDIAQESIARAMARLEAPSGPPISDLGPFVRGIARHLIADALRSGRRNVSLDQIADPAAAQIDPLSQCIANEEQSRVHSVMATLSAADRTILRLSFFDGLGPNEIAERTAQDAGVIRKRKSRALERLRRAFLGAPDVTDRDPDRRDK